MKFAAAMLALAILGGCRQDMHDAPRYEPLEPSKFFADGRSSRMPVEGTIARGQLREDEVFFSGLEKGQPVDYFPFPVTEAVLRRGQQRFNVYCTPCHSATGDGNGMIVQRGYKRPTSYHTPELRAAKVGHFVDVMTKGFGVMPDYAMQISPADRWAVAAYIRALQASQGGTIADVPQDQRQNLDKKPEPPEGQSTSSHGEGESK
jgi:mono/diheme cytochrome c family protein